MQQKTLNDYKVVGEPWEDRETMRRLYINEKKSIRTIADLLGCSSSNIKRWLGRHDIETRSPGHPPADWDLTDPDKLRELYVEKGLSTTEIGQKYDCSRRQVSEWLKKHDIPIEARGSGTHPETRFDLDDREMLKKEYVDKGRTMADLGDEFDCSPRIVCKWLHRHEIPTRDAHASGPENPCWGGGKGYYYALRRAMKSEPWDSLARSVYERDGYECQSCGETFELGEGKLDAHHIVPVRAGGQSIKDNLISLCKGCHNTTEAYLWNIFTPLSELDKTSD